MAAAQHINNIESIDKSSFTSEIDRIQARDAARALLWRLETPLETGWRLAFDNPASLVSLKVLKDLGVFDKWRATGIERALSVQELAEMSGSEPALLNRLLRHLDGARCVEQVEVDKFKLTPFTTQLGEGRLPSMIQFLFETILPVFTGMPEYFKTGGYKEPRDASKSPLKEKTGVEFYDYLALDETRKQNFANLMTVLADSRLPWPELYPTQELVDGRREGHAILVDIGGNQGHDMEQFLTKNPGVPKGSLVLQDRPEIVGLPSVKALNEAIAPMAHDFFTEQPVKGARAYFLHHILHNWNDANVVNILKQVAKAMEPGYSSVLIMELSNASMHPISQTTSLDIGMMAFLSAKERTDIEWEKLFTASGLVLKKIWSRPDFDEQVMEATLP